MDRIWLKNYPAGIPADIDVTQYSSVAQIMEESFVSFADRNAYVCMDKFMTFRELDKASAAVGAWLQSKGLKKGDRVAIMLPNVLQFPVCFAAVVRAGFVAVCVNPLYTPRELQHQLKDSGAKVIFILENFAKTLEPVAAQTDVEHIVVTSMGDMLGFPKGMIVNAVVRHVKKMVPAYSLPTAISFKSVLSEGSGKTLNKPSISGDDVAFLQYTGGTTGVSKGATLLHRNVVANVLQNQAWLQPALDKEPVVEQLTIVTALPLYHIFALGGCCILGMRVGGMCLLIPNPRDIPGFVKELAKYKFNMLPAVNTLYNALVNNADFQKLDFSGLKAANGGGMATQRAVAEKFYKLTGVPIVEGYGLSETAPTLTCNRADNPNFTGSIGYPVPNTFISIRDDDGNEVPMGQPGEICAKGPQVMAGYWNRPDETAKVMTPDGYFKTGDIGVVNEQGEFKIVDRKKDMVIVSGFNVFPNEVEDVVASHPGVMECAVIGVPDDKTGEAVKLFVVKKDPALTEADLQKFCGEQMTAYKKPKFIVFRDELPKSPVGKILRRELRDKTAA